MMEDTPWNCLPNEIIENILLKVPTADMPFDKPFLCKQWTNILLQPKFWVKKLKNIDFIIDEDVKSVLSGFEKKIQVACLYHTCLNEELMEPVKGDYLVQKFIPDDFGKMLEAACILITRSVDSVGLILNKKRIPALNVVLKLLAVRRSSVTVLDYYGFWNFSPKHNYLPLLKGLNEKANINTLIGCVSTLHGLGQLSDKYCKNLMLSIPVDEYNKAVDPGISTYVNKIGMLHIKAGTDISIIENVNIHPHTLIVSGLEATHISWLNNLAETLGLNHGYSLILCSYQLNRETSEELLQSWKNSNVKPEEILCASSDLTANDIQQLNELAHRLGISQNESNLNANDRQLINVLTDWMGNTSTAGKTDYFMLYKNNEELIKSSLYYKMFYYK